MYLLKISCFKLNVLTFRIYWVANIIIFFELYKLLMCKFCVKFRILFKTSDLFSQCCNAFFQCFDFGVWALVTQMLSAQVLRTVLLWVYNHWIPSLRFNKNSFHELFGFGWKMMVSNDYKPIVTPFLVPVQKASELPMPIRQNQGMPSLFQSLHW